MAACGSGHEVTYHCDGSADRIAVSYTGDDGETVKETVNLPWEATVQRQGNPLSADLEAENQGDAGEMTCEVLVDGESMFEAAGQASVFIFGTASFEGNSTSSSFSGGGEARLVTANDEWRPVTQEFDGVEMALVPAGCFSMGSENGDVDELPLHEQCFEEPFWIDVYEVTNGQYGSEGTFSGDDRPREDVDWRAATRHCESRGARLPTEAEWEYAARGPDGLTYPWGNDFIADNVVYEQTSGGETATVGSKPSGASWVGALDMGGNVWEWVSSIYWPYPYDASDGRETDGSSDDSSSRVLRGGSVFRSYANDLRAANRVRGFPRLKLSHLGFRCARSSSLPGDLLGQNLKRLLTYEGWGKRRGPAGWGAALALEPPFSFN